MADGSFSILQAVRAAYVTTGREAGYFLRLAVLPLAVQIACNILVMTQMAEAGMIREFLVGLPASVFVAWYQFVLARRLILGERAEKLSPQDRASAERAQAMRAAVMLSVLFGMGVVAISALSLTLVRLGLDKSSVGFTVMAFGLMGIMVWFLRIGVLPLLAAVHYPLRDFLAMVDGFGFSIRLLGMGFLCVLPVTLLINLSLTVIGGAGSLAELSLAQKLALSVTTGFCSLLIATLLNAASIDALRQILGRRLAP